MNPAQDLFNTYTREEQAKVYGLALYKENYEVLQEIKECIPVPEQEHFMEEVNRFLKQNKMVLS